MVKELKQLIRNIQEWHRFVKISKSQEYLEERLKAEIIRYVHAIEKGLSIENPRLGFGVKKINLLMDLCDLFIKKCNNYSICLKMAIDALNGYIEYHNTKNWSGEDFECICARVQKIQEKVTLIVNEKCGGVLKINSNNVLAPDELDAFLSARHSIRSFKNEEIDKNLIAKSIKMAQKAPSACNRQAVRAYVVSSEKLCNLLGDDLSGIGGFAQDANKFILITGKLSAYRLDEYNQFIVSASIFSAYLSLSLLSNNIGSCIVQRPLRKTKGWDLLRECFGIADDEQMVCMLAIGYLKDEYIVPVSYRLPVDNICKFIE